MPEPDLLIRTSGEMRISNFLLWQISYAEILRDGHVVAGLFANGTWKRLCWTTPAENAVSELSDLPLTPIPAKQT